MSVIHLYTRCRNHISNGPLLITVDIMTSENFTPTSRCLYIYVCYLTTLSMSKLYRECSHLFTLVPRSQIFLPSRWRRYVPPKRRLTQNLHGTTSQKTTFFIVTAVKTSDFACVQLVTGCLPNECGAAGTVRIGMGNRNTGRKPTPVSLCPPQIPRDLTWDETWAAPVTGRCFIFLKIFFFSKMYYQRPFCSRVLLGSKSVSSTSEVYASTM
jgi:hypothetical protein